MTGRRPALGAARAAAVVLLGIAAAAGCNSPAAPADAESGGVRVTADRDSLRVTNGRERPVFTFAVGTSLLPSINWAACADAARCAPVAPGGSAATARSDIDVAPGERDVTVFWWHAGPRVDGVVRPDSIRAVGVRLP